MGVSGVGGCNFRKHVSDEIESHLHRKARTNSNILKRGANLSKSVAESYLNGDTTESRRKIYKTLKLSSQDQSDETLLLEYINCYGEIVFGYNGKSSSTLYKDMTKTINKIADGDFQIDGIKKETKNKIIVMLFISKLKLAYQDDKALKEYKPVKDFLKTVSSFMIDSVLDLVHASVSRRIFSLFSISCLPEEADAAPGNLTVAISNKSTDANEAFRLIAGFHIPEKINTLPISEVIKLANTVSVRAIDEIKRNIESLKNKKQISEKADTINEAFNKALSEHLSERLKKISIDGREEKQ